jgi:hypothetical protein
LPSISLENQWWEQVLGISKLYLGMVYGSGIHSGLVPIDHGQVAGLPTLSAHTDGVAIEQVRRNHRGCPFTAGHSCPDCATVQRSGGPAPCAEHATDGFRKPHRGSCCFPRTACTQSRQPSLQQSGSSRGVSFKQRLQGPLSTCGGRHSIGSVQHWIAVAMDSQAPRQGATHRP